MIGKSSLHLHTSKKKGADQTKIERLFQLIASYIISLTVIQEGRNKDDESSNSSR